MESLGTRLKEARQSKHLTLEDVSKETKIQIRILETLESDMYQALLNPTYVKSFIKKYADFLGLDGDALVRLYASQRPAYPKQVFHIEPSPEPVALNRLILALGMFVVTLAVLVLLWVVGAKLWTNLKYRTPVISPPAAVRVPAAQPSRRVQVQPAVPSTGFSIPKTEPLVLTVKTTGDDCWLRVKCDGKLISETTLPRNSQERWEAREKIELHVGNAGFLRLDLNGRSLGSPGRGVIKNIVLDRNGMHVGK